MYSCFFSGLLQNNPWDLLRRDLDQNDLGQVLSAKHLKTRNGSAIAGDRKTLTGNLECASDSDLRPEFIRSAARFSDFTPAGFLSSFYKIKSSRTWNKQWNRSNGHQSAQAQTRLLGELVFEIFNAECSKGSIRFCPARWFFGQACGPRPVHSFDVHGTWRTRILLMQKVHDRANHLNCFSSTEKKRCDMYDRAKRTLKQTRKPHYRKKTARFRSFSFQFKVRRHSLQV